MFAKSWKLRLEIEAREIQNFYTTETALILLISLPNQDDKHAELYGTYGHMKQKIWKSVMDFFFIMEIAFLVQKNPNTWQNIPSKEDV